MDLPDPFIFNEGGVNYLYVSTAIGNYGLNVPVFTGSPGHWGTPKDALPVLPGWATPNNGTGNNGGLTWAPEVFKVAGKYLMYFSPRVAGAVPVQHCIGVAVASSPAGPFVPQETPLICQRQLGGDIDGQLFNDPAGPNGPAHPLYLIWKSDNNSTRGAGIPTVWAQPLADDGMQVTGTPVAILRPAERWQHQLIEAPQMVTGPDGRIWLFFSGGQGFYTGDYGMGAASCAGPLGPCRDASDQPLITTNAQGHGPGEETIFTASDASTWMLYNPWGTGNPYQLFRPAEGARIGWGSRGPYIAEAGSFPPP